MVTLQSLSVQHSATSLAIAGIDYAQQFKPVHVTVTRNVFIYSRCGLYTTVQTSTRDLLTYTDVLPGALISLYMEWSFQYTSCLIGMDVNVLS